MINIPGTLTIRIITGRNGDFRVWRLVTEIGEFAVKDAVLDQYDEGKYEGIFEISLIYPSSYNANGRFVIEVRAKLESIALANMDNLEQEEPASMEQDPIDEEKKPEPETQSSPDSGPAEAAENVDQEEMASPADTDTELFGMLWPLNDQVKLDPTVDRGVFRQQRDRLKAMGYTFKAMGQMWIKEENDA